ncbi:MAG: CGNR zinc finger domain-containing protein [Terrimesophilobacter sp.]
MYVDAVPHVPTTGQWLETDGVRWWFDSGSIALDFAHTGALPGGSEQLHSPTDLGVWLVERFPRVDAGVSERELSDALLLRESIGRLVVAVDPAASDIDIVNLVAAMPDIPPALGGGSRQAGASHAHVSQALSTIAREAIGLFDANRVAGIRTCSAGDCAFIYLDTSRSGSRRWCSMQRCGNRAKVRAYRGRAVRGSSPG